jgi:hypothetical protein
MEVAVSVDGEPRPRVERIEVAEKSQTVTLRLERQPKAVVLDPDAFVLMDADVARADGRR